MTAPRRSDIRPGSAECRRGIDPADAEQIRLMAKALRRDRNIALIDLGRIENEIERKFIERIAMEQGV